jgi:FtsZ-binding cell division protein ZapB
MAAVGGDRTRGHPRTRNADRSAESGWVTTEVAAKAVRVSPRTIRRYIERGELEAKPQGEGVNRTWLVSVDSLHALRATRTIEEESPQDVRLEDSMADVFRDLAARLEARAAEAAELRTRLELTERAQSTLEEEVADLRRRRDELERERDKLRQKLEARESPESGGPSDTPETPTDAGGGAHEGSERRWWEFWR